METAPIRPLFKQTSHPYTLGLLQSLPEINAAPTDKLIPIEGTPPNLYKTPQGCPFAPRCRFVIDTCWQEMPPLQPITPAHYTACWQWETVQTTSHSAPERPTS